jgi:polar amino acid transport system substrate-binding protein
MRILQRKLLGRYSAIDTFLKTSSIFPARTQFGNSQSPQIGLNLTRTLTPLDMPTLKRILLFLLFALGFSTQVLSQSLPNHTDPSTRDDAPDLAGVPSLRFLTGTDFPPFNYRDDRGQLVGFHIDLAKAICASLDISCTMQAWPWAQVTDALASNQGDVLLAGLAIDEVTAEQFDFSSLYLTLPGRFVTAATNALSFDPFELGDKNLAVREGSAHETFVKTYFPDARITGYATELDALTAVADKTADAFFGDALRASYWLNDNADCCAFAGEAYFNPQYFGAGLAAAIPAGRGAVREAINYALLRLKRNGKLDELYLRWFPISFY